MITFLLGFTLGTIFRWLVLYVWRSCTTSIIQTNRKENGMLTRNKKLKDYGIPAEDIEK